MQAIRLSKIVLLFCLALYMLLIVFNNVTDYGSNFAFVSNVMGMTDVFDDSTTKWRSISHPGFHHVFYIAIIAFEACIALSLIGGISQLWLHRQAEPDVFNRAKKWVIYGLTGGVFLWMGLFLAVAGEWFLMWQSESWNGVPTAGRNSLIFLIALMFISTKD